MYAAALLNRSIGHSNGSIGFAESGVPAGCLRPFARFGYVGTIEPAGRPLHMSAAVCSLWLCRGSTLLDVCGRLLTLVV